MELFKEDGTKAGLFDVCQWWLHWYPDDIFITEPPEVVEIQKNAQQLLSYKR